VEATAPTLQFHESDQSLINGYRRFRMNGSNFSFERNTSSVAAWNSYVSDLKIDNTGLVTAKDIKIYGSGHGGAIFQETDEYDGSIEIIPIIDQYTISANKLYFAGAQEDQWRIAGGGLGITGNSNINGGLSIGTSTSVRKLYVYGGDDYNTVFCSASFRSGYALRKPGTTTTMGSCLLLEDDETYRFGTAAAYHIIMYQDKNTIICGNGSEVMRITTGRVGIMASSPLSDAALDVGGSTKVNASIYPRVAITSNASRIEALQLQNLSPSTTAEMRFITAADDDTYLAFTQPSSTNTGTFFGKTKSSGSFVFSNSRPLYIGTITAQELGLGTSNITRATIDSSGNFKTISGDIQTGGTFKSSDGSPGINISLCMDTVDGQVHDIVITDGLITQWDIE